jgi:hypothetical protein
MADAVECQQPNQQNLFNNGQMAKIVRDQRLRQSGIAAIADCFGKERRAMTDVQHSSGQNKTVRKWSGKDEKRKR